MYLGIVSSAVLFGSSIAVSLFIAGHPVWLALLAYSAGGALFACLLILRVALRDLSDRSASPSAADLNPNKLASNFHSVGQKQVI